MSSPLYLVAAVVLLVGWLPPIIVALRSSAIDGLVALELVGALTTLVVVCLAAGLHQSSFAPLALITGVCTLVGGLVFTRFLDRLP